MGFVMGLMRDSIEWVGLAQFTSVVVPGWICMFVVVVERGFFLGGARGWWLG